MTRTVNFIDKSEKWSESLTESWKRFLRKKKSKGFGWFKGTDNHSLCARKKSVRDRFEKRRFLFLTERTREMEIVFFKAKTAYSSTEYGKKFRESARWCPSMQYDGPNVVYFLQVQEICDRCVNKINSVLSLSTPYWVYPTKHLSRWLLCRNGEFFIRWIEKIQQQAGSATRQNLAARLTNTIIQLKTVFSVLVFFCFDQQTERQSQESRHHKYSAVLRCRIQGVRLLADLSCTCTFKSSEI